MSNKKNYLFKIETEDDDIVCFAKNAKEALDIASKEILDWEDIFNVKIDLLCFYNQIINLDEANK